MAEKIGKVECKTIAQLLPWGICSSKHIARVIVAVMAEALGESFSLEELETICSCRRLRQLLSSIERAKFLSLQKYGYFLLKRVPLRGF
jgi:hypothetical protein